MNILAVAGWIHPDAEGGSFRYIYELNRALAELGHNVTILTGRLRPELPREEVIDGMRIVRYEVNHTGTIPFYLSTLRGVARELPALAADADVINLTHPASAFAAARCKLRTPMLYTLCIAYFLEYADRVTGGMHGLTGGQRLAKLLLRRMEYYSLKACRNVVVLSDFVKGQIEQYFPAVADRVSLIAPGVDLEMFNTALPKEQARRELELPADAHLLLTIRRMEPRMGLDNLIKAMPAIRAAVPGCKLVLGGRGSLETELRELAAELLPPDAVHFAGYIDESQLNTYYRAADLFVLPTRALEGYGLVTLEAMACGTPAIVTPAGASPEVASPVDPELVAEGVEADQIAEAVMRFFKRSDNDALAAKCREHAEKFTWKSAAEGYEKVYREIAG